MIRLRSLCTLCAAVAAPALSLAASLLTPISDGKLLYETTSSGDSREAALTAARQAAVKGSAGRVLLGESLIMADELLDLYLDRYYDKFVTATEVVTEDFVGGRNVVRSRVFVDYQSLVKDLDEKRFLFTPAPRPVVLSFLAEKMDNETTAEGIALSALNVSFLATGMKPFSGSLPAADPQDPSTVPSLARDVAQTPATLAEALVLAQRNGAEVLVTGTATTSESMSDRFYYDNYLFYECTMETKLLRVDTGEVLFTARATGNAAAVNRSEAIQTAIQRAATSIADQYYDKLTDHWGFVVRANTADYQVMLTGADEELQRVVARHLERLGGGTEVALRKAFDKTAVLVVRTDASRQDVLEQIASCSFPTLTTLNPADKNRFEVQVGG
ncbi:MAG: hypothetical protein SF028_11370 [Candidatus Sumerlaeia bacterium]|nr:hypothetical protein [Candidatus Sumerlaeia bacterium]